MIRSADADNDPVPVLATELTGDLPCLGCGYNLRGMSIRALCPECGTAVRATILAHVDPMAEELRPIKRPVVTAAALILWAWAAVAAAACVWGIRLIDVYTAFGGGAVRTYWLVELSLICITLSGVGAIALVRPVAGQRGWDSCKAAGAVVLYALLILIHYRLHVGYDGNAPVPYVSGHNIDHDRSLIRLAENLTIATIILGLRPSVISLAERSLVMRLGRVDTQPLLALVASLGLASLGDALLLTLGGVNGLFGDLLSMFVVVLIAVGSFLFTLGLVGTGVDAVRLRPVLIRPSPGLSDIFSSRSHENGDEEQDR